MAEDTTPADSAPDAAGEPEGKSEGKGLRSQLEAALAENRELKAEKRDDIIKGLGLSPQTGLGMALSEQFDKGELALDEIASTATDKYGHVVPDVQHQHPQAEVIQQQQAALDEAQLGAGNLAPPSRADAIAEAEAAGDWKRAMALKLG